MTTEDLEERDELRGVDDLAGCVRAVLGPRWVIAEDATVPDGAGGGHQDLAADRVETATGVLEALLNLGWTTPDGVIAFFTREIPAPVGEGVRSLAEDLAVVRSRARTAGERSREQRDRARRAVTRSQELVAQAARQLQESRGGARDHDAGVPDLVEEVVQLRSALSNRPRIEHAVGIVMSALGADEEKAFTALSALSQHTNVKVRDLSDLLVARVGRGGGLPPDVVDALRVFADGGRAGSGHGPQRGR